MQWVLRGQEKKEGEKDRKNGALFREAAVWRPHLCQSRFILIQKVTAFSGVAGTSSSVRPLPPGPAGPAERSAHTGPCHPSADPCPQLCWDTVSSVLPALGAVS